MLSEPIGRQARDDLKSTLFLEEVCRAWHNFQLFLATQFRQRILVQADDYVVVFAHDEERGSLDTRQCVAGEVGTPAARDDCVNASSKGSGSDQGSATAGA
jgi:hypothetical protein